ncbi:MAG: methyltransferase domain-containing protein [Chloroflexi bacterium]|nr:methyltransferase domain-containing protein [Chloroflexota bacterium]
MVSGSIDEAAIYAERFPPEVMERRYEMWQEIAAYLQRYVPRDAVVLDIGAGEGYLLAALEAGERWAVDLRPPWEPIASGIRFVRGSGLEPDPSLVPGTFDRILMSNYLEHLPTPDDVIRQLQVTRDLLRPGGRIVVLQPNIRHVGGAYWDFIDHKVALTHHSLEEAATLAGLRTVRIVERFLPYTTKGRLPIDRRLVRLYLRLPLAWRLLGQQTLFIAERPT